MKKSLIPLILILTLNLNAQSLDVQIQDSLTLSPIAFSTVSFSNNKGLISDEDGMFELVKNELVNQDSLFVSSLGYQKASFALNKFKDSIVFLLPKPVILADVILTSKRLTSEEIIEEVIKNIERNYEKGITQNKVFVVASVSFQSE